MKLQHVPLADIVPNPWRDMTLFPFDADHVAELSASIKDHGFFGGVKGRRRNGKIEIGCGHSRIEAARSAKPRLDTVPIFVADMDDDEMLRLMTDENATQAGSNPGAVINEVAAVTRRIIEGLLGSTIVPASIALAFESESGMARTRSRLRMRLTEPEKADIHLAIGDGVIARYLGQGDEKRAHRGLRQLRTAISTLKQSGRYDDMVDEAIRKHPQPVDGKVSKSRAVAKTSQPDKRKPILDARTANLFPNEHQFDAFREAITTQAAQKVIPVESQYELAKSIIAAKHSEKKKQVGALYIKTMVHHYVDEGMKAQRKVNKEERDAYLREQREARIDAEVRSAETSLRALVSSLTRLHDLANEYPAHPRIGGFSAKLDMLVGAIKQLREKLR